MTGSLDDIVGASATYREVDALRSAGFRLLLDAAQAAAVWRPVVNNPAPHMHRNDEPTMMQQRAEGKAPHDH